MKWTCKEFVVFAVGDRVGGSFRMLNVSALSWRGGVAAHR